jgi:hypothetical protein
MNAMHVCPDFISLNARGGHDSSNLMRLNYHDYGKCDMWNTIFSVDGFCLAFPFGIM